MPQPKYSVTLNNGNPIVLEEDAQLAELIHARSREEFPADTRIQVTTQFNRPSDLTPEARASLEELHQAGAILVNHTPILKGINDDPFLLSHMLNQLAWIGVTPSLVFIQHPESSDRGVSVPLKRAFQVVEGAKALISANGNPLKLVMYHSSGKIEIVSIDNGKAYLRYHHSKYGRDGHFMMLDCPDDAIWFDELPGSEPYGRVGDGAAFM
ncbi:hypothetical protein [Paenibacillus radicis (ex Gao et al. 2016)]|uniref:Radical SAM protein n=1 Tax=Paenibacillus radicis (ex Gao et al. 2016) TaxID=1737354 RepID=A0A917LYV5_9BACL|nr:hypothetical protein [Paenibacillus radicis (ex Gao et al. 2016)]GGG66208.1 hypothetical protein GCM10010918_20800 [Paenibacillus radicis (ex Gao et al. 2016)]